MENLKSKAESVAADKSAIGFEYQYYLFLWKLLSLQSGQSVGLECKDDVHTDLDNDVQILFQIKHTVQYSDATNKPKNLTTLDSDLWKTISNWCEIVADKAAGRDKIKEQIKFLDRTFFILASNKSYSANNKLIKCFDELKDNIKDISTVRDEIKKLKEKTNNINIIKYISNLLYFNDMLLEKFINKISFQLDESDIFKKCRDEIKSKMVPEHRIDDVFKKIDSSIREDNFIRIKSGLKVEISFDEFYRKYRRYFELSRNEGLQVYSFDDYLPNNLHDQTFIRQLLEINDIKNDDIESMASFTRYKLKITRNIQTWIEDGELIDEELSSIEENCLLKWSNLFRKKYRRGVTEEEHNGIGLDIIDSIREFDVTFSNLPHDTTLSNGYYYYLSDVPKIGWRNDWLKYKNEK
ncbi:hypothetical protein H3N34_06890 [Photobacterium damselae subsp. damselae]|uniref:hypothetical protein n=1 Tax=Photobacterium damselae TaxID=38293 RepID=UPI0015F3E7B1|nr:hypothetical protein [Photobacterium damselae]MBA5682938.1 hypothetical protein [Photobacterium damselae subsp. damselae]